MSTVDLTVETFEQTLRDNPIVLVDFWAEWCAPCRMFDPVYATAAARHDDIVFGKVDTDAQQQLAVDLEIASIPTLLAFRDGQRVRSVSDAMPPRALQKFIDDVRAIDMATFGRDPMEDIPELDM